jgi:(1->4)-alpha-D-glucan 1-alpha-D-glucosylmutase
MSRIPSSTYRLQLHAGFPFEEAARVSDYIAELGVSHIYSSPVLQTAPGSTHGYDVTDFKAISQELGGGNAREAYQKRLEALGLGQVLDIVPNHMSLAQNNSYWRDVLENGRESRYADYFDVDWDTGEERMRNKILLPVLGDQYGMVLKSGAIQLKRTATRFEIEVNDTRLPAAPSSTASLLESAAQALRSETLGFLADSLRQLPGEVGETPAARRRRQRNQAVLLSLLTRYLAEKPEALDAIDEAVVAVNADADALDAILQQQHYRLAYWKAANQDLGYRRFFDVNSLIGVRVDREEVFADTHEQILQWLDTGAIDGLRVDHADGMRDPLLYFDRLRERAPDTWIVAEKILARNETLRVEWPVQGTTGYEFLNCVNGLLVSKQGLATLEDFYHKLLGSPVDYPTLVHDSKIAVMAEMLGSDVNWLSSIFVEICERDRDHRDHTRMEIRHAIREVAACYSVYRTYVSPERNELTEMDAAIIHNAAEVAWRYRPDIDRSLYIFLEDVLLLRRRGPLESEFLLRFQQFTGPVMAKGFEDTTLYRYNRMVGVNEVGSSPSDPAVSVEEFHRFNARAQREHPLGMLALSTHDTKRGEDVRARVAVITEAPEFFVEAMERSFANNSLYRKRAWPDPNTEYLYYQTLIGAWPVSVERMQLYMEKATREAKQQTSWTNNNEDFEEQVKEFIRLTLEDQQFISEVQNFVETIDGAGRINSLAQTLLKCTSPGVPDLYQGSELWDHRLVDPDNRRDVDFEERRRLLAELDKRSAEEILQEMKSGMPKLWTIQRALQVRKDRAESFGASGSYTPIDAQGEKADHVVAYLRGEDVATIVPRLSYSVKGKWSDTALTLAAGRWKNALTGDIVKGGEVRVQDLFARFPVALLVREK